MPIHPSATPPLPHRVSHESLPTASPSKAERSSPSSSLGLDDLHITSPQQPEASHSLIGLPESERARMTMAALGSSRSMPEDRILISDIPILREVESKAQLERRLAELRVSPQNIQVEQELGVIQCLDNWKELIGDLRQRIKSAHGFYPPTTTRERLAQINAFNRALATKPQLQKVMERLKTVEALFDRIDAENAKLSDAARAKRSADFVKIRNRYTQIHQGPSTSGTVSASTIMDLADTAFAHLERYPIPAGSLERQQTQSIVANLLEIIGKRRINNFSERGIIPDVHITDEKQMQLWERSSVNLLKATRQFEESNKTFEDFSALKAAEGIEEANFFQKGRSHIDKNPILAGRFAFLLDPKSKAYQAQVEKIEKSIPESQNHEAAEKMASLLTQQPLEIAQATKPSPASSKKKKKAKSKSSGQRPALPDELIDNAEAATSKEYAEWTTRLDNAIASPVKGIQFEGISAKIVLNFIEKEYTTFAKMVGFQQPIRRPDGSMKTDFDITLNNMIFEVSCFVPEKSWNDPVSQHAIETKRRQIRERIFNEDGINPNYKPVTFWSLTFPQDIVEEFIEMSRHPKAAPFFFARTADDAKAILRKPEVEDFAFAQAAQAVGFGSR